MMKGPGGQPMMPPGMRPGGPLPGGPVSLGGPIGPGGPGDPEQDGSMDPSSVPSSLSGSKVPNENLNPEQRKKRAEKLGFLHTLNRKLFPPSQGGSPGNFPPGHPGNGPQGHPGNGPPGHPGNG